MTRHASALAAPLEIAQERIESVHPLDPRGPTWLQPVRAEPRRAALHDVPIQAKLGN